jgi:hypothetical protein
VPEEFLTPEGLLAPKAKPLPPNSAAHWCHDLRGSFESNGCSWTKTIWIDGVSSYNVFTADHGVLGSFRVLCATWRHLGAPDPPFSACDLMARTASLMWYQLRREGRTVDPTKLLPALLVKSRSTAVRWKKTGSQVSGAKHCGWLRDLRVHAPYIPPQITSRVFVELNAVEVARAGDITIRAGGAVRCALAVFIAADGEVCHYPWDTVPLRRA